MWLYKDGSGKKIVIEELREKIRSLSLSERGDSEQL
jgi:hypothetical protein